MLIKNPFKYQLDQLKRKALLYGGGALAATAGISGATGYLAGQNNAYRNVIEKLGEESEYSMNNSYMCNFGFQMPKANPFKLRQAIGKATSKVAESGNLVSSNSTVRKKAGERLSNLQALKRNFT